MNAPLLAKDIMVTKLVTLAPHLDVFEAVGLLLRHRISGAPVIDEEGRLLGVLSERCCMCALAEAVYDGMPTTEVRAFMDTDHTTITEETDFLNIIQLFLSTGQRRLPVLRDGKLVGQISRRDVLCAAHKLCEVAPNRETALLYLSSLVERNEAPIA